MRAALTSAGARMLEAVLAGEDGYCGPRARCGCGGRAGYAGSRDKTVTTVLGPVTLRRAWYHCRECHSGFAPEDERLGVGGVSVSAGLAEMIALAGALRSPSPGPPGCCPGWPGSASAPGPSSARPRPAAPPPGWPPGPRPPPSRPARSAPMPPLVLVPDMLYVEVDGTGVPVRASETEGRQGKDADGRAGTREVKLARLFTVSRLDDEGRPVTDPGSSSYAFTFDGKDALAGFVKAEYLRRGGEHFRQVVALGERRRLDLEHGHRPLPARHPHRGHLPRPRAPPRPGSPPGLHHSRPAQLAGLGYQPSSTTATSRPSSAPPAPTRSQASKPKSWTRRSATSSTTSTGCATPTSKKLGMFTGSGAIEAACKQIVAAWAKQSGMHWAIEGAADIIALRCQHASGRWDELWPAGTHTPARPPAAV